MKGGQGNGIYLEGARYGEEKEGKAYLLLNSLHLIGNMYGGRSGINNSSIIMCVHAAIVECLIRTLNS